MRRSDGTNKMIKNERGISYKLEYRFWWLIQPNIRFMG
jgi:hypothetical protein